MEFDIKPCLAAKIGASVVTFQCFQFDIYILSFSALKNCCSSESVGGDASMGVATFDLKRIPLPFRGAIDLAPGKEGKKVSGNLDVKVEAALV